MFHRIGPPHRGVRHHSSTGFTLIEMLVVLGIVALLMGLVLVAIRTVQKSGRTNACLSNLRQLSYAHTAYSNLYHEYFVDVGLPHGGGGDPAKSFVTLLAPFHKAPILLKSPLDQSPYWDPALGGDGTPVDVGPGGVPLYRITSYGMNDYLSRTYSPKVAIDGIGSGADRLARVPRPESMVCFLLMTELGDFASSDHVHVETWADVPDPAPVAASQAAIAAIDRDAKPSGSSLSNWSFIDGHCSTARFDTVYQDQNHNQFDPGLQ